MSRVERAVTLSEGFLLDFENSALYARPNWVKNSATARCFGATQRQTKDRGRFRKSEATSPAINKFGS
jgi:hypothetical protein